MLLIMRFPSDIWPKHLLLVWYLGSTFLVHVLVTGTSVQSWQHLLKHPHYADDGHQHARHVGTPRSRNTRIEETTQDVTTESTPHTWSTTRIPRTTPTVYQRHTRTYHTSSRSPISESASVHPSANSHNSSRARELSTSSSVTTLPNVVESRTPSSKGPSVTATPAVRSRISEVTFPPRDFYNLNGSPEGFHKPRKNSDISAKPKMLPSLIEEIENVREANEHFMLMRGAGRCKVPRTQVVRVKDFYPDPTKEYLPRCTLLHRCNDQSGCCDTEGFQCMAKVMQEVALTFYVIHVGKESQLPELDESVTKLLFVNHTECECLPVDNLPRAIEKPSKSEQNDHHHHVDPNPIQNHPSKCQECPLPFCKREYPDGRCSCDCFDRQRPCLRIKRGREPLQEIERRCVETRKCHIPECEYGTFDAIFGRCPRRPEDHQRKNNHHQKNHHRWTFFERD